MEQRDTTLLWVIYAKSDSANTFKLRARDNHPPPCTLLVVGVSWRELAGQSLLEEQMSLSVAEIPTAQEIRLVKEQPISLGHEAAAGALGEQG